MYWQGSIDERSSDGHRDEWGAEVQTPDSGGDGPKLRLTGSYSAGVLHPHTHVDACCALAGRMDGACSCSKSILDFQGHTMALINAC